jgi:hypothetical protein
MSTDNKESIARVLSLAFAIGIVLTFTACGGAGAGGGSRSIVSNSPVLAVAPSNIAFGSQIVGSSTSLDLTLSNTGQANLTVSNLAVTGTGFLLANSSLPLTIAPNQNAIAQVQFVPQSIGNATGSLTVTSDASNTVQPVGLSGLGVTNQPDISFTPTSLDFGNVVVAATKNINLTIKSIGGAPLTVNQVNITGTGYSVNGFSTPIVLNPNQSVTGQVSFSPLALGPSGGNVSATSNSINSPTVNLNGAGVAATHLLSVSPATLTFGNVMVGSTIGKPVTLTNTGNSSVTVSAANTTGDYSVTGIVLPSTVNAGASRTANINFAPQITGPGNGTISFVSNATNSPAVVTTTGSGITASTHSVDLTWDPSPSTVIGYFIYRGSSTGGPYAKSNVNSQVSTAFTDFMVDPGDTYFYVVTAIDANGIESFVSNEAPAAIPTP